MHRSCFCGVERKGAGVRKAIEHTLATSDFCRGEPIVFLIEEEPRLLPILNIHGVANAVFDNLNLRARRFR